MAYEYETELILLCVRWYLRYSLSYRDVAEMIRERGLALDHTTIYRWVQRYAPELERRCRPHLRPTNDSWRVDETYIKVKGVWTYLYRAVDSAGNRLDFMLSPTRDGSAATRFFRKVVDAPHTQAPRVVNVDQNAAYPPAISVLKADGDLPEDCMLRRVKYLNNIIEQDHRFIKRLVRPGLGFGSFTTAMNTLSGYETMHMIRKGQLRGIGKDDSRAQAAFVERAFGLVA
ncbi:MAG: IS6 family transposase [Herpetosiphon sp.]